MHIHFIEPRADGHRMQFVRRLIEQAPADARLSLSTFASCLGHPGTQQALAAARGRIQVFTIAGEAAFESRVQGADGFRLQPTYWRLFRRHWRSLGATQRGDLAIVPYLDYCSYAIGLMGSPFGGTAFSGIVMRPDFHWADQGVVSPPAKHRAIKRFLFRRLLRHARMQRLLTIDASLRDWVSARQPAGHTRLRYADDPSDMRGEGGRTEARAFYGLRSQTTVVMLFGSIDLRKGVAGLLATAGAPTFPSDGQILMVGRQSAEVRALVLQQTAGWPGGRLVCVDRYVSGQEEWLAFAAADFVWVAYEGFYGPSGVVAQCRQAGLPMIHRQQGVMGYLLAGAEPVALPWLTEGGLLCGRVERLPDAPGLEQVFSPLVDQQPLRK